MFREMRRKKQLLSEEDTLEIINNASHGVLSVLGDDNYPYGVPLSYYYEDGYFYFHTAKAGHKVDAINNYDKASFCIVDKDEIIEEEFTSYFRSVVAFGKVSFLEDEEEKIRITKDLSRRYSPNESEEAIDQCMEADFGQMDVIMFEVEDIKGKEAIELVREKAKKSQ